MQHKIDELQHKLRVMEAELAQFREALALTPSSESECCCLEGEEVWRLCPKHGLRTPQADTEAELIRLRHVVAECQNLANKLGDPELRKAAAGPGVTSPRGAEDALRCVGTVLGILLRSKP